MVDVYGMLKDIIGTVAKIKKGQRAEIERASNLISDVCNNAEYVESTYYALRNAALPGAKQSCTDPIIH